MDRINRISCVQQADGSIDIVVPAAMAEDFKLMVKKGTNLSPDMHVEIRDFTDRILGRDKWVGSCMKEVIYGHQTYAQMKELAENSKGIISTHWDIPEEDKYEVEVEKMGVAVVTEEPVAAPIHCIKCASLKHQHPNRMCDEFTLKA